MSILVCSGGINLGKTGSNAERIQQKCEFCGHLGTITTKSPMGKNTTSRIFFTCSKCKKKNEMLLKGV